MVSVNVDDIEEVMEEGGGSVSSEHQMKLVGRQLTRGTEEKIAEKRSGGQGVMRGEEEGKVEEEGEGWICRVTEEKRRRGHVSS